MKRIVDGVCEVCGAPADLSSHIGPDSYLQERRVGVRIIRDMHHYCQGDYDRLMEQLWNRVRRHLL